MASNPSPPNNKRARTDAGPSRGSRQLPKGTRSELRLQPSSLTHASSHVSSRHHHQQQQQQQQQGPLQPSAPSRPTNNPSGPPAAAISSAATPSTANPLTPSSSSVPAPWGALSHSRRGKMTMSIHEALQVLDPKGQAPHDLYSILVYSAARHPDVAEMLDKFANLERQRLEAERQREAAAREAGVTAPKGPTAPARPTVKVAKRKGPVPRVPREVVEKEKQLKAERKAARMAVREARAARSRERQARKLASTVVKPGQDKDFTYLVRKAEGELGRTGRYDDERDPDRAARHSRVSLRDNESFWHNKAIDVRDSLKWMQDQLVKEMGQPGGGVSFGTRRNALVAMRQIICAVVVDESALGVNMREHWFDALVQNFKRIMALVTYSELDKLRTEQKGRWVRDMKKLLRRARERDVGDAGLREILLTVDGKADDGNLDSDSEDPTDEDGTADAGDDEDGDSQGPVDGDAVSIEEDALGEAKVQSSGDDEVDASVEAD